MLKKIENRSWWVESKEGDMKVLVSLGVGLMEIVFSSGLVTLDLLLAVIAITS